MLKACQKSASKYRVGEWVLIRSSHDPSRLRSVSTADQNPDLQLDALREAGCYRIFVDKASGALDERPELAKVLDQLQPGNTLVVWKLDRLGRSLRHLIDVVGNVQGRGVGFRSLHGNIDTTTPGGKLVFHVSGPSPSSSER